MRSVWRSGGVAVWLAFAGAASGQTPPYPAVVARDEAEVRAGPSDHPQMYVTNRLRRGEAVQVVEELANGWLKVRPPAGSFSLVNTRYVQQVVPNQPNWVIVANPDVRVPVLVGTDVPKEVDAQIEGGRLARGAQLTSLGAARVDGQGNTWLPIEPPPGEFRYVRADAVVKADGTPPAPTPPPAVPAPAAPAPPTQPVGSTFTPAGSTSPPPTEVEALWTRAQQAERAGNIPEAIECYGRAGALGQSSQPELALQALNRAHWLREGARPAALTPSPVPPGDVRLTPTPAAPPNVQLAGPVGISAAAPRPQPPGPASSGPGRLRRAGRCLEGRRTYVLESYQNVPLYYVTPEPGVDLEPYVNQRVELFGASVYSGELRANYMRVERAQPAP